MRKRIYSHAGFCFLLYLILLPFSTGCQSTAQSNLVRIASYDIACEYEPSTHQISGRLVLRWKNTTGNPAESLQFHTYMNAFSGKYSTYFTEAGVFPEALAANPGRLVFHSIQDESGQELVEDLVFVQPQDQNPRDSSLAELLLPQVVAPGQDMELMISFTTILPPMVERTGHRGNYVVAAQWFPKVAVFTDDGWQGYQYHYNSEYFADFGDYQLQLTLPQNYVVGATGRLTREKSADEQTIHYFEAKNVHDFAWVASPDFAVIQEQSGDVNIRYLILPEHRGEVENRIKKAVVGGLAYFRERVGEYPYSTLTCVDAPVFNIVMEYPTLFLTGNFDGYANPPAPPEPQPLDNRFMERLTLHELGHQWFYGMSANDEGREAWLDEGMTDYITAKAFEHLYGPIMQRGEDGREIRVRDFRRDRYLARPAIAIAKASWEYPDFGSYYIGSYVKPKLMLHTLDEIIGNDKMEQIVSSFFNQAKFMHPTTGQFLAVLDKNVEAPIMSFVRACLTDSTWIDFRPGKFDGQTIEIIRDGGLSCPVDIRLEYVGGRHELIEWSGDSSKVWISNTGKALIESVIIDPMGKIEIELDRSNNRRDFDLRP